MCCASIRLISNIAHEKYHTKFRLVKKWMSYDKLENPGKTGIFYHYSEKSQRDLLALKIAIGEHNVSLHVLCVSFIIVPRFHGDNPLTI